MNRDHRLWLLAALTGCHAQCARPSDDRFEPNDDVAHATHLERGAAVTARSVENDLDAWSFDAQAGEHLTVVVKPWVIFGDLAVYAPDGSEVTKAHGSTTVDDGWRYDLDAAQAGTYTVTVEQGSAADNQFWFKWDYAISVSAR